MYHFGSILLLLIYLVCTLANQIIFEQVGEMASSVTYLHVKFEVDLQDIEDHIYEYEAVFPKLKAIFKPLFEADLKNISKVYNEHDAYSRQVQRDLLASTKTNYNELDKALAYRQKHVKRFLDEVKALRDALPRQEKDTSNIRLRRSINKTRLIMSLGQKSSPMMTAQSASKLLMTLTGGSTSSSSSATKKATKAVANFIIKQGTSSILGAGLGALGTFMGLFNTYQIYNLKKELREQREAHNRLVEVVQEHEDHLQLLDEAVDRLRTTVGFMRSSQTVLLANELGTLEEQIRDKLNKATHVIQIAQTRRLAIDFLPAEYLTRLYQQLENQAQKIDHKLLTKQPSDLFQLELSYFFDGINMQLLLHVPTVPVDSILRLLKLHPFPLPLNKNYSVIPVAQDDLLAISSGFTRYSAQLSSVDLLGCHQVNNVYLCERHGVLGKQLNNSCLGAMYLQDFDLVQELCSLQITPAIEVVRQLQDNWFLVFSPSPQTAYISCRNGTNNEAYFKTGITKTYLSPGCKMNLNFHLLQSDFSLQLPDEFVNFQWDWDTTPVIDSLEQDMEILKEAGNLKPTLKDIKNLKITRTRSILTRIFFISITGLVAIAIVIMLTIWCFCKDLLFQIPCIKSKIKHIKKRQSQKKKLKANKKTPSPKTPQKPSQPNTYLQLMRTQPTITTTPLQTFPRSRTARPVPPPRLLPRLYPSLPPPSQYSNTETCLALPTPPTRRSFGGYNLHAVYMQNLGPEDTVYSEIPVQNRITEI